MEKTKKLEILEKIKKDFLRELQENVGQEDYLEVADYFKYVFEYIGNENFIQLFERRYLPLEFNWNIPEKVNKKSNFCLMLDMLIFIDDNTNIIFGEENDKINFH